MALEPPSQHERLTFGFTVLTGYKVEVQVKSGMVYEGIFHAANYAIEDDPASHGVILKYARVVKDPSVSADKDALAEKPAKVKRIPASELVMLTARDVRMNPEDLAAPPDDFETDAAISRGRGGQFGRDLQRWMPEPGDEAPMLMLEGEDGLGWDQFAVNKQKFGVSSTYDETIYTTVIDRMNCGISEQEAARLAREIENGDVRGVSGMAAYHLAEERGMEINDDDMNEEDRYGAVVRDAPHAQGPGAKPYQPPRAGYNISNSGGAAAAAPAPAAPPRAWGGAGAGVAAVAGRPLSSGGGAAGPPGLAPSPPPPGAATNGGGAMPPSGQQQSQPAGAQRSATSSGGGSSGQGSWRAVAASGALQQHFAVAANGGSPAAPLEGTKRSSPSGSVTSGPGAPLGALGTPQLPQQAGGTGRPTATSLAVPMPIRGATAGKHLPAERHAVVDALNLAVPGPSSTPPDVNNAFAKWKATKKEEESKIKSLQILEEMRAAQQQQQQQQQGAVVGGPSAALHPAAAGIADAPASTDATADAVPSATDALAAVLAADASGPQSTSTGAQPPASTAGEAPAATGPPAAVPTAPSPAPSAPAAAPKKSSLNPFAKEFTLNILAKPFVPGSGGSGPSPAMVPGPGAGQLHAVSGGAGYGRVQPPPHMGPGGMLATSGSSFVGGPHALPLHGATPLALALGGPDAPPPPPPHLVPPHALHSHHHLAGALPPHSHAHVAHEGGMPLPPGGGVALAGGPPPPVLPPHLAALGPPQGLPGGPLGPNGGLPPHHSQAQFLPMAGAPYAPGPGGPPLPLGAAQLHMAAGGTPHPHAHAHHAGLMGGPGPQVLYAAPPGGPGGARMAAGGGPGMTLLMPLQGMAPGQGGMFGPAGLAQGHQGYAMVPAPMQLAAMQMPPGAGGGPPPGGLQGPPQHLAAGGGGPNGELGGHHGLGGGPGPGPMRPQGLGSAVNKGVPPGGSGHLVGSSGRGGGGMGGGGRGGRGGSGPGHT